MRINGQQVTDKVLSELSDRKISKTEFSRQMGFSLPTFYVREKAHDWSIKEINLISEVFNIPINELIGIEKESV